MSKSPIPAFLRSIIAELERDLDLVDDLLEQGEGHDRKVRVLAYAGYRNSRVVRLKGRIVRHEEPLNTGKGRLARLRAMLEIYNSNELAGIGVRCEGYGQKLDAISDAEGYFEFELAVEQALPPSTCWEHVTLTAPDRLAQQPSIKVPILAPGTDGNWGIISDIDDTIIETGATNFLKNWRRVLVDQPHDRLAVPGASSLYKMIARDHPDPARPFFYVSSSPWNLYGFIAEFMELNGIPHGPMFLKDYGIDPSQFIRKGHEEHKLAAIETVFAFYPDLRFLLIGDNGQRDVSIYAKVVSDFPGRVAAVFIRDVDSSCRSGPEADLLRQIEGSGVATFCGAGFGDAVAVVQQLDLDRPLEAASAVVSPGEHLGASAA
ncbi:phosphatase domain-containing protein [Sphingomonas sp. GCM10030256]|uniref:phosphatase domain-containing protein n=1 Tax=Sphingomonas sp. GCM10030256 TaxID=3273427 RepID=UPI0036071A0A